jgi:hypothetical protein
MRREDEEASVRVRRRGVMDIMADGIYRLMNRTRTRLRLLRRDEIQKSVIRGTGMTCHSKTDSNKGLAPLSAMLCMYTCSMLPSHVSSPQIL